MAGTGVLGGTFNPVHVGHIRHAVEVGEALGLDRVLLMPCSVPPHKTSRGLLPFDLRVSLLRAALEGIPLLDVETLEGEMPGPSYTCLSLQEWGRRYPEQGKPFFLLGMDDFVALASWHRGRELPSLAHLVVVPRAGSDRAIFYAALQELWPDGAHQEADGGAVLSPGAETVRMGSADNGGLCTFLPVPRLDVSASFLRQRWLQGRSIHGLMPEAARLLLKERCEDVRRVWAAGGTTA